MRHEICVADMSPVRDLPGMEGHCDTWQVQCSCGWRNFALMTEAAADEVAAMHRDSFTRAEKAEAERDEWKRAAEANMALAERNADTIDRLCDERDAMKATVNDALEQLRHEEHMRTTAERAIAEAVARLLDSEVDPEAAWTKGNIP